MSTPKNKRKNVEDSMFLLLKDASALNSKVVQQLTKKLEKLDVNSRDEEEWTLLFHAVFNNRLEAARILIENGSQVNLVDALGRSPLYLAAGWGDEEGNMVKLLLDHGASHKPLTSDGSSPLHVAALRNKPKAVEILCEAGADVLFMDPQNRTASEIAKARKLDAIVTILNKYAQKRLFHAAKIGDTGAAHLVFSRFQLDPNVSDLTGWTPLHVAMSENQKTMAKLLFNQGANPEIKNGAGKTPINLAAEKGFVGVITTIRTLMSEKEESQQDQQPKPEDDPTEAVVVTLKPGLTRSLSKTSLNGIAISSMKAFKSSSNILEGQGPDPVRRGSVVIVKPVLSDSSLQSIKNIAGSSSSSSSSSSSPVLATATVSEPSLSQAVTASSISLEVPVSSSPSSATSSPASRRKAPLSRRESLTNMHAIKIPKKKEEETEAGSDTTTEPQANKEEEDSGQVAARRVASSQASFETLPEPVVEKVPEPLDEPTPAPIVTVDKDDDNDKKAEEEVEVKEEKKIEEPKVEEKKIEEVNVEQKPVSAPSSPPIVGEERKSPIPRVSVVVPLSKLSIPVVRPPVPPSKTDFGDLLEEMYADALSSLDSSF